MSATHTLGWVGEIIDDDLWAFPRPARWHVLVASLLGAKLVSRFGVGQGGPGGWWLVDEPELHTPGVVSSAPLRHPLI